MLINRKDLKLLLKFVFSGIIIFCFHYLLFKCFHRQLYTPNIFYIHPFLLSITILAVVAIKIIIKKSKRQIFGFLFMSSSLIKMALSIAFLFPVLQGSHAFRKEYVLQFFMTYFIYLIIEVYYLVRDFKSKNK